MCSVWPCFIFRVLQWFSLVSIENFRLTPKMALACVLTCRSEAGSQALSGTVPAAVTWTSTPGHGTRAPAIRENLGPRFGVRRAAPSSRARAAHSQRSCVRVTACGSQPAQTASAVRLSGSQPARAACFRLAHVTASAHAGFLFRHDCRTTRQYEQQ